MFPTTLVTIRGFPCSPDYCRWSFNLAGYNNNLDLDLRLFYDYIKDKVAQTAFTKELDATISRMKQEKEERNMYLTYTTRMMESRRDGFDEGISIGLQQGIEQGLERGAHQKALETAKTFLSMGFSPEQVAQGTNLPLDVVQGLL
ncbi:MAG: hypothetical protein U0I22_00185 [Treponema sp.]|nr:hypothetical protein [Treponema sp.]